MKIKTLKKILPAVMLATIMTTATACGDNAEVTPIEDATVADETETTGGAKYTLDNSNNKDTGSISSDAEITTQEEQDYENALKEQQADKLEAGAEFTVAPYSLTMYVSSDVNYRTEPNVEAKKLGTLRVGTEVAVTGKVNEVDWYEFEQANGQKAYVSGSYLSETKQELPSANSGSTTTTAQQQKELNDWLNSIGANDNLLSDEEVQKEVDKMGGTDSAPFVNDGRYDDLPAPH